MAPAARALCSRMRRAALPTLAAAVLAIAAEPARAGIGRVFATDVACAKAAGFGSAVCRQLFAAARAEFESKTRPYPNRFACYRAYGPCMPWPAGSGASAQFRPQWMGVLVGGPPEAHTALPVVASGRIALALAPRGLGDVAVAAVAAEPAQIPAFNGRVVPEAVCRNIETAALKAHLPPAFLARLLWQESSFRADVVSPAGARGIAQFMPATAEERGLADPFDATRAIETSAGLIVDLVKRFGNLGLAAAAYNGGPARVSGWLKGERSLAAETQDYVRRITGRPVEAWAATMGDKAVPPLAAPCRFEAAAAP